MSLIKKSNSKNTINKKVRQKNQKVHYKKKTKYSKLNLKVKLN